MQHLPLEKLKEIDICTDSMMICLIVENESGAMAAHNLLSQSCKTGELELILQVEEPHGKETSYIDLSICCKGECWVKKFEIKRPEDLYLKLLYLKSNMGGFIPDTPAANPFITLAFRKNGYIEPACGEKLPIQKLTVIPTPGGEQILKIPGSKT